MDNGSLLSVAGISSTLWRSGMVLLAAACLGIFVNSVSSNGIDLRGPVPPPPERVSLEESRSLFQDKESVFVDARSREEFDAGHIAGALLLSLDDIEESISSFLELIPLERKVVVYCSGTGCGSSGEVAEFLKEVGYSDIHVFSGGWEEWAAAGYPIAR